jgi:hypothetical protein
MNISFPKTEGAGFFLECDSGVGSFQALPLLAVCSLANYLTSLILPPL